MYQGQGQVITYHRYCRMQLLVPALIYSLYPGCYDYILDIFIICAMLLRKCKINGIIIFALKFHHKRRNDYIRQQHELLISKAEII